MLFLIVALVLSVVNGESSSDASLFADGLQYAMECSTSGKVNYGLCLKMFEENKDLSDPKFDTCKCVIPCIAKKMKVMTEEGKWDVDAVQKIIDGLENKEFQEEGKKVLSDCKNVEGLNCVAGFNAVKCSLKSSKKLRAAVEQILTMMVHEKTPE